jgi:small-conductance mechanosensitive channel
MGRLTALYFGNPVWLWLVVFVAGLLVLALAALVRRRIQARLHSQEVEDPGSGRRSLLLVLARNTSILLVTGVFCWSMGLVLSLPDKAEKLLRIAAIWSLAGQALLWVQALIGLLVDRAERRSAGRDPGAATMIRAMGLASKAVLWTVMILMALHNAGVDITALVAGLGIGGIAVALALQNILSDVFSSVAILFDKPYRVGDFIAVGDSMGTVERIGIKTTRIRSLSGEQLVFSNGELLKSRIRNFERMSERRVEFWVGAGYQTPYAKVELVPSILREIISGNENVRLERANFKEFGESSLTFECVYFVKSLSYNLYLDIQESINLQILRRFQEEEIELTKPNRMLYVAQGVAPVRW